MGRLCCLIADMIATVGLWEMVFKILLGFEANLHVLPLFTGFYHPSCPEDTQVRYEEHFPSLDWGVSSLSKLHPFFDFFE